MTEARKPSETPYLHVRPPRRVVGVGGEGDPVAKIHGNGAGLAALGEHIDAALAAEDASMAPYREADGRCFDLFVMRATKREQMGEPREPERPDYSMFTKAGPKRQGKGRGPLGPRPARKPPRS